MEYCGYMKNKIEDGLDDKNSRMTTGKKNFLRP